MTLRALIEDINKYSNGKLKARVNHTASGIIVACPSRRIEYILYDKDSITPGIWGEIKHFKPWNQDTDDDACPFHSMRPNWDIPCWSLANLLSVLDFPSLIQNKEDEWEVCVPNHKSDGYIEISAGNPVDVCYEMVLKLKENNKL